ncbi:hypothetical protein [Actinomyces sp. ICM47]|jgi:hypothetical protein|uniref:hypothetical protein n=1 Tax=Actinomyces sp. ICM47 TaxID=936548 RepID=UPI0025C3C744|nr:hypothetical protein [Actinomyces sp. ICM47]
MTVPINNPQPDSYGDSVPYQGSMPYQSGGLYPGDGFYQGGVPYQNGGFYQGGGSYLGYPQTYVAQPQVSFPPRVDRVSISCGIAGWVVIVLALLATWLSSNADWTQDSVSGELIISLYSVIAWMLVIPLNLIGGITGLIRMLDRSGNWRLAWLGLILNISPLVITGAINPFYSA